MSLWDRVYLGLGEDEVGGRLGQLLTVQQPAHHHDTHNPISMDPGDRRLDLMMLVKRDY